MQENHNEIIYAESFHEPKRQPDDVSEPVPVDEQPPESGRRRPFPVLLTIQLAVCVLIALTVFILSITNSPLYKDFRRWYRDEMSRTLISDTVFGSIDLRSAFTATADEVSPSRD